MKHVINANICTCDSWNLLKKELITATQKEKFKITMHILKASRILQSWLKELQLKMILYTDELDYILKLLLQNLNSGQYEQKNIIFECLIHMIAHDESNKDLIQKILTLPFMQHIEISMDIINNHAKEVFKSVDTAAMLICLEVLCEYGRGEVEQLKILHTCIMDYQTDIAAAAVL